LTVVFDRLLTESLTERAPLRAIGSDERVMLTVSTRALGIADLPGVCFSMLRIVGAAGVLATLEPTRRQKTVRL
jgi:hypothetical protein